MSKLTYLTIEEALKGLNNKDFTAVELAQAHIDAMEANCDLNAFIMETPEIALAQAAESDKRYAASEAKPLDGIPFANKDLFCTEGVQTTAASKILEGFIPQYESTVSSKLFADGAVMLGKANLDQFAMGSSNTTSAFGNVISPWKATDGKDLVPGGSSGGSAAAVAARMAMGATATDTGGSIRQPASFCGIVGIKPTYGRCSRWGVVAFASSLDTPGPLARTVKDNALLLASMAGHDAKDSTSANRDVPDFASAITGDIRGLKIGIPKEFKLDGMPPEIEKLWEQGMAWLKEAGAELVEISLPHTKYALPTYYIIAPAEASSNLARYDGVRYGHRSTESKTLDDMYKKTRAEGFGDEVKRRIMIGAYVLSAGYYDAYYIKAQKVRRLILQDFEKAYETVDAILTPTAPSGAFAIGENEDDPIKMYLNDVFTVTANLAGIPAMSVPAGLDANGLPLGLQILGRAWDEETVFKVGGVVETAAQFSAIPQAIMKKAA
ncbi:MAG: Asp-tRNA(Asn)/Glu-tRNA(Gln) amidotransferase subunit GatA [Rhodospirillales bacterium]|nr:Asp-tRNA(Asn)/Glu-tRNA(Gln) amidotransferase subunit GatA [Alphaproteobacteria bacterium]USO06345.1 MAG: Asp-tRNA(Asn)/Glu-tRNA(Gln) amidotransferase subunit GatA [Rhodospirillales bacterium]